MTRCAEPRTERVVPGRRAEQVCYRTSHHNARGAVVTKHPRVRTTRDVETPSPARARHTALPRASTPLDRRRPSSRNHDSSMTTGVAPAAPLARSPASRPSARPSPRPLAAPPGDGRLQEEGRAPDHHPRVHRAEGLRRGRHVRYMSQKVRCGERTPRERPTRILDARLRMDNRAKIAARETLAARNPILGLWCFSSASALFRSRHRRFSSHPAPFASLTSRPTLLHLPQNRRNTSERLELMKYNPYLRRHTLHRELKK